jgi:type II secretory pathway pseudopilin PulG
VSLDVAIGRGVEALKRDADSCHVHLRARDESGFGLLELLMAMVMLNVAILALVSAFSSSSLALARSSRVATASTLADTQMEVYRGAKYSDIVFTTSEWTAAVGASAYTGDTVYQNNMASPPPPKALVTTVSSCPAGVPANACDPSYTTTGADHQSYEVDTYLYYDTPTNGGQLKTVTVVVRDARTLQSYARSTSTFDPSTGT